MTITTEPVSISDVALATGLSTHTLRYYERAGLMLTPVDRASSTHRRYTSADIEWVRFIGKLRQGAMPIARIREYVGLARGGEVTAPARLRLLEAHRVDVMAQLADITQSLAAIDYKIAVYKERIHAE